MKKLEKLGTFTYNVSMEPSIFWEITVLVILKHKGLKIK